MHVVYQIYARDTLRTENISVKQNGNISVDLKTSYYFWQQKRTKHDVSSMLFTLQN